MGGWRILARHASQLSDKEEKPGNYYLETASAFPELLKGMSPELKRRMQGKSCLNFTAPDEKLFSELGKLTDAGLPKVPH